jgi:RNA polymerase sigma-B factor
MRSTQTYSQPSRAAGRLAHGREGQRELFSRWQRDEDQAARDELVERFLPLARKLARRYSGAHEPFDDLFQVASCGLLKALDRFDPERGIGFSSFAVPTIVGELKRYFRDLGWSVHVPRGAQELALKIQRAQQELTARTGRSPTVHDLAQYIELSIEQVLDGLEAAAAHHAASLDVPNDQSDGDAGTLADMRGVEDAGFALVENSASVAAALHLLSDREREVLTLRFFGDRTQSEIAAVVGVSQMQISRILREALARLAELTQSEASDALDRPPASSRR